MLWGLRPVASVKTRSFVVVPTHSWRRFLRRHLSSSSSSSFDSLSWSELRQKVASTVTDSLTEREREALMAKYKEPTTPDGDNIITAKTIAEAVAEARAKEAEKQSVEWENNMEGYKQKMEDAAMARIQSDLILERKRLMFERWKLDLEKAQSSEHETEEEEEQVAADDTHALLGPVVADLGTKRIHLVAAEKLADLPVWKRQRTFRMDRAQKMAHDKVKTLHLGIPGIIGLVEDKDGNLFIIDGQHRVGMMKLLAEMNAKIDLSKVLVEVHTEKGDDDFARELFIEINKAEPVKQVDLPGVTTDSERLILTHAVDQLKELYPNMFSSSQQCRKPHVNMDNLRDDLFSSGILKKHDTSASLLAWILEKNEVLAQKYAQEPAGQNRNAKALEKAHKFKFYLGLESTWLVVEGTE